MYLKRKTDDFLAQWKSDPDRKPLIIRGPRQVGKTETIRKFAAENYENVIEINFVEQPKYKIITGEDPDQYASEPVSKVTAEEKMKAAYPDRVELVAFIKSNYDEVNLKKLLTYYKAAAVEDLTTEQLIVCYNRKKK